MHGTGSCPVHHQSRITGLDLSNDLIGTDCTYDKQDKAAQTEIFDLWEAATMTDMGVKILKIINKGWYSTEFQL